MKNILRWIGFIIIIVVGFWVGMQWGSLANNTPSVDYEHIPTPPPAQDLSPVISAEVMVSTLPVEPDTKKIDEPTKVEVDLPKIKDEKVIHYSSNYFKYGFDLPANIYYSAFGGTTDGAKHTVAIAKNIPETLADGSVRVYFYGKKIVPELQNAHDNKVQDPAGKFVYLLLNGQYSIKIEANDINNPVVQKIIQTITIES